MFKKIVIVVLTLLSVNVSAQETEQEQLIADLLILADQFATPAATAAIYQANAGWFSSAAALGEWKVDVSVHGNALFVPSSQQTFNVSNRDFNILRIKGNNTNAVVPTAFGKKTDVFFEGNILGQDFEFQAIEGVDKQVVIHPFVQVNLGLPYKTEIAARFIPEVTIGDVGVTTYGLGLKHSLSQYFDLEDPEDFQVAVMGAYNIFDVTYEFTPVDIQIAELSLIDVDANLWVAQVMGSKLYENFEVFGALGAASSDFQYLLGGSGPGLNLINTSLKTIESTEVEFKGDVGFNVYFGKFKVSAIASAGKYFNFNTGLHFRF